MPSIPLQPSGATREFNASPPTPSGPMSIVSSLLRNPIANALSGGVTGRIADAASAIFSPGQATVSGNIGGPFGISGGVTFPFGGGGAVVRAAQGTPAASGGACPRGYHLNKHALGASRRHGALPARAICVRNRSMNPLNHRALTKALKREKRAKKILGRLHIMRSAARAAAGGRGHRPGCGCFACRKR